MSESEPIIHLPLSKSRAEPNEEEILDTLIGPLRSYNREEDEYETREEPRKQERHTLRKHDFKKDNHTFYRTNVKRIISSLVIFVVLSIPQVNQLLRHVLGPDSTETVFLLLKSILFVVLLFVSYLIL